MTGEGMMTNDFACPRLLEPFARTLMGLQLWHWNFLEVARRSFEPTFRVYHMVQAPGTDSHTRTRCDHYISVFAISYAGKSIA